MEEIDIKSTTSSHTTNIFNIVNKNIFSNVVGVEGSLSNSNSIGKNIKEIKKETEKVKEKEKEKEKRRKSNIVKFNFKRAMKGVTNIIEKSMNYILKKEEGKQENE